MTRMSTVRVLSICLYAQFIEGMSEKIRKGIEAAETDLSKEKEKKQQEEVLESVGFEH